MKYAILGDVHANLEALQAVLDDAERQVTTSSVCSPKLPTSLRFLFDDKFFYTDSLSLLVVLRRIGDCSGSFSIALK